MSVRCSALSRVPSPFAPLPHQSVLWISSPIATAYYSCSRLYAPLYATLHTVWQGCCQLLPCPERGANKAIGGTAGRRLQSVYDRESLVGSHLRTHPYDRLDQRALHVEEGVVEGVVGAMEDGAQLGLVGRLQQLHLSQRRHVLLLLFLFLLSLSPLLLLERVVGSQGFCLFGRTHLQ